MIFTTIFLLILFGLLVVYDPFIDITDDNQIILWYNSNRERKSVILRKKK